MKLYFKILLIIGVLSLQAIFSFSQTKDGIINLQLLASNKSLDVFNRELSLINEDGHKGIRLNEKEREGLVWLKEAYFSNGIIEFDVRGKDVQGRSFVGIAFHGLNNTTYDAIYLRPFNFKSSEAIRRSHGIQYISHPIFTWSKLREEFPNKYEQAVEPAPDPNGWVYVRVAIENSKINAYVNHNNKPSLTVEKLTKQTTGTIGFFVGNGSSGDFSNLKITRK
jgi:hypothetical protein